MLSKVLPCPFRFWTSVQRRRRNHKQASVQTDLQSIPVGGLLFNKAQRTTTSTTTTTGICTKIFSFSSQ